MEDLTGISMLPGANQDNWKWYYASPSSFGFIYTGAGEGASVSAVDAAGKAGDIVADNPWAQNYIRGYLRNQGLKISNARIARYAGRIGKYAGWYGKLSAAKSAYDRYTKCRAF